MTISHAANTLHEASYTEFLKIYFIYSFQREKETAESLINILGVTGMVRAYLQIP